MIFWAERTKHHIFQHKKQNTPNDNENDVQLWINTDFRTQIRKMFISLNNRILS